MHALEDEALVVVQKGQDALQRRMLGAIRLHQILHPRKNLSGSSGLSLRSETDCISSSW